MNEKTYRFDELIIFVVRNGFVRIIMSGVLMICYLRAICEKEKLWILSKYCYVGLTYLIIDWWIILLKTHVYRRIGEYFWINTGVAIFITFTMPPLWILRYAHFIQSANDSKLGASEATENLESYVSECWDLKENPFSNVMQFQFEKTNQMRSTIERKNESCYENEDMNMTMDWCDRGKCFMKQMPEEMLEQVIVLSAICFRWFITGNLGLDQLVTYFISTASDIVDFASTMVGLSEKLIEQKNKNMMKAIIAAYFISLSQFSVNLSGKRKHDHTYDTILWSSATIQERCLILIDLFFGTEIWGILTQMATEDGLLLALRIATVIKFDASTLENLFFVMKNILTIAIFTYYAAAILDSYIRHRFRYQNYIQTLNEQFSEMPVDEQ